MRPSKCARITFSKVPFLRETKRLLSTDYALFDGRLSKSTVKVARFAFAGIDYLAAKQDRWQKFLEKVAAGTDSEKLVNAHPQITGPVIEGMAYVDEDSIIGEMFVSILRKAIQSDTQDQAHPAFPRVIQQLSDDEAIILFKETSLSSGTDMGAA